MLDLQHQAWPTDSVTDGDGAGHDPALRPVSVLLVDDGIVLAALDVLRKEITHSGRPYQAGGLSTVVTRADVRGKGHGGRLVVAAREAMPAMGLDLGLFTCDRHLQSFYERAGWQLLPGAVLVGGTPAAPFPSDQAAFDKVTLAAFFTPAAQAARASFEHARIELFPGTVDKLW